VKDHDKKVELLQGGRGRRGYQNKNLALFLPSAYMQPRCMVKGKLVAKTEDQDKRFDLFIEKQRNINE